MQRLTYIALVLGVLVAAPSCQRSVPPVPVSNRTVVQPKGSTDVTKSWNRITRNEGDSVLGPLSNARR